MEILVGIGFVIVGLIAILQLNIYLQMRQHLGKEVPDTDCNDNTTNKHLYYFHSPDCRSCNGMNRIIKRLQEDFPNIIDVDIKEQPEIAAQFFIRATPTSVLVVDNKIEKIFLGPQEPAKIRYLLNH